MTNYQKGRKAEYEIMDILKKQGEYPIRTAGSHSQFDILSLSQNHIRLIQSKATKKKFYGKIDINNIPLPPNTTVELWIRKDGKGKRKAQWNIQVLKNWIYPDI